MKTKITNIRIINIIPKKYIKIVIVKTSLKNQLKINIIKINIQKIVIIISIGIEKITKKIKNQVLIRVALKRINY